MASPLTSNDLAWFQTANAGSYSGKQAFYSFKARFLKRFGSQEGFDLQTLQKECWTCNGAGWVGNKTNDCRACDGSGIHHTAEHWLERWNLAGTIYHIPYFCSPPLALQSPVHEYEGLIKHKQVDEKAAYRCFLRLLIRHEPATFYWHVVNRIKDKTCNIRTRLVWRWIKLRNKLDLFPAINEDDVPF